VSFTTKVNYAAWQDYLWHAPVLRAGGALGPAAASAAPDIQPVPSLLVSTGPMVLDSTARDGACYRANPRWWGWKALRLRFSFRYLCDLVSSGSGQQLSDLLDSRIDWSNALLRGVPDLVGPGSAGYGIKTFYPSAPYMLAASTAWLEMNAAKPPMSDINFRRAVAAAIDPTTVVDDAYMGTVSRAGPTGLLPNLASYIDSGVVKKYALRHSVSLARKLLASAPYRGQQLELEIPAGLPDLASAAGVLAKQLGAAGIHVAVKEVTAAQRSADISAGRYDMVIDDRAGLSVTPWDYFDRVFSLPLGAGQAQGLNAERLVDPAAWRLVEQAAATPPTDAKRVNALYVQLEADFLQEVPEVPVWYTGAWFEASTKYWDDFPSSTSTDDRYTPVMWPGWLGSTTTVLALAALKPR